MTGTRTENADKSDSVYIDVNKIPDYKRDNMCAAVMELYFDILSQPGGQKIIDQYKQKNR